MRDTFLRRRRRQEKQGILDVAAEFGGDTKVNVELQIKIVKNWDKRQLFYLAKMYTEDLIKGEDYSRLKRCIGISLLDFNLSGRPKAHTGYRLRDEEGNELTDALEIHLLELNKPLTGEDRAEEWIRFFNVKEEDELRMIKTNTKNPGILEAVRELQRLSMNSPMKRRYDAYLKRKRDEKAREAYVREEGEAIGEDYKLASLVCRKLRKEKDRRLLRKSWRRTWRRFKRSARRRRNLGLSMMRRRYLPRL